MRIRGTQTVAWAGMMALLLALAAPASGSSVGRKMNKVTGNYSAPTVEDGADYFAKEQQKGVSAADLKRADDLRLKTIASVEQLMTDKRLGGRKFELLLRLGELHVERHDYLREVEMNEYTASYARWEAEGKKQSKEPQLDNRGSRQELTKAANAFRTLVTDYPKHPGADAPLFALGRALTRLENENAILYFQQLIKYHPKSRFVAETQLAMGEYWFDRHQIAKAIPCYEAAMRVGKDTELYPYAVYKLGWAHYNAPSANEQEHVAHLNKSITAFKLVVKLSDREGARRSRLNLRQEAINDLVMVWAEVGDVDSAFAYFKTIDRQESFYQLLERLGWIYSEAGKSEMAITTYERLLKEAPTRAGNPEIHAKVVALKEQQGDLKGVVTDLREMKEAYTGQGAWALAWRSKPEQQRAADDLVEKSLHRYGALFHQRGQKMKVNNRDVLSAASQIYRIYLETYPARGNAYDIRFYLADILFEFGQFDEASDEYSKVALARPKDGSHLREAALNAVVCMNNVVQATKYAKLPPLGQVAKPLEIPPTKAKLVRVIDQFVRLLPKDAEGHPMRYTAASVFFDYGQYPEALKRFDRIVAEIPKSKQAEASAKLVLAYHIDREDFTRGVEWARKMLKSQELMAQPGMRAHIEQMLRNGVFRRAMALEKDKKHSEAGDGFVAFQKEFPKDVNADRALYNATLNYYKAGRIDDALAWGGKLMEEYPKSEMRADLLATLAQTHEAIGQYEKAAYYYRALAFDYPKDARANGALFNAAVLNKGLGKLEQAVGLYRDFATRQPSDPKARSCYFEVAALEEKGGRHKEAYAAWQAIFERFGRESAEDGLYAEAKMAQLNALYLNKASGQSELASLGKRLSVNKTNPAFEARRIVAEALFRNADEESKTFEALKVTDASKIESQVAVKQQKMERLASNFDRVIAVGNGEFTVASLYRLGEMSEDFAQTLFKAPSPKGASQEEIDNYRSSIEKVAFPLKQEAHKFFAEALKRSREVETFSPWTQRAYQKMSELEPELNPEIREIPADPSYMTHRVSRNETIEKLAK